MVGILVLCRHGECEWNERNLFCGWYDSPLTELGKRQAQKAGEDLKNYGVLFGRAHTSLLSRAIQTCEIILHEIDQECVPVYQNWRLNERHYGALTGLNKGEIANEFGEEQVQIWRRSYKCPPPAMDCQHKYFQEIVFDPRYESDLPRTSFPLRESLEKAIERVTPYWNNYILRDLKENHNVLVVAHGNSIAAIMKILNNPTETEVTQIQLLNGVPVVYELNEHYQPKAPIKFLGDPETVAKAISLLPSTLTVYKPVDDTKKNYGLTCG